jgi:hypothetical protein
MAPRTLVWIAEASLAATTYPSTWVNSPGGGSCGLGRGTSPTGGLRFSDKAAAFVNGVGTKNFTASSVVLACAAGIVSTTNSQWEIQFWGDGGTTQHLTVTLSSGSVVVRRGTSGGTLLATGSAPIPTAAWFHLQAEATIGDAGGTVKVRVNGASVEDIDFTGDTKNGGTATTIDRVSFVSGGGLYYFDDLNVWTGAGDWPGDTRVCCLLPSGNGTTNQGTGSDGNSVDNYLLVDERPDSSSDYVGITTDDEIDLYTLADLPAGVTTVHGVQTIAVAAKSDAGAKGLKLVRRSGGANHIEASSHALSTSYGGWSVLDQVDPATAAAWTASAVNDLEAGWQAAAS